MILVAVSICFPSLALAVGAYNEPNSLALVDAGGKIPSSIIDGSSVTKLGATIEWSEVQGVPAGFADGVDDTGGADSITPAGTVASSVVGTQFDNRPPFLEVIFFGEE